jgi:G:T-mismatch repair DNA endonuclease (very short patch repair protein)
MTRDAANVTALETLGWRVFVAWECEVKADLDHVVGRILETAKRTN